MKSHTAVEPTTADDLLGARPAAAKRLERALAARELRRAAGRAAGGRRRRVRRSASVPAAASRAAERRHAARVGDDRPGAERRPWPRRRVPAPRSPSRCGAATKPAAGDTERASPSARRMSSAPARSSPIGRVSANGSNVRARASS